MLCRRNYFPDMTRTSCLLFLAGLVYLAVGSDLKFAPPLCGRDKGQYESDLPLDSDCQHFIRCIKGVATLRKCPAGLFFDPQYRRCDPHRPVSCRKSDKSNHVTSTKTRPDSTSVAAKYVVCYYTNWSQYRPAPAKFTPEDIQPKLCTHIHYAFAKLNDSNQLAPFEWNDESTAWSTGMYEKVTNWKKTNPSLKILLSVGGWNMGSAPFTKMAATAETRKSFIQEIMVGFQQESQQTGNSRLLLSSAVPGGKATVDAGYEVDKISAVIDYLVLMSYDYFGSWDNVTGHVSPLYAPENATQQEAIFNLDFSARYWVKLGCPKDKLVIGLVTYGRGFTLTNPAVNGLRAPANGPSTPGTYTRQAGFLAFYEICKMLQAGAKVTRLKGERVPYLVLGNQWIGYEDAESLTEKVDYIKTNGFAGAMIWDLALDDFTGDVCTSGPYPLIHTVASHILMG